MRDIHHHPLLGSTNDEARRLASAGARAGTLVTAEAQTAGRGRRGATWHAPSGLDFLGSVILYPEPPLEHWPRLTHACALAVCDVIDALNDVPRATIKWPNDVYVSDKKICGILVETVLTGPTSGFVIVGLGLNVNSRTEHFPNEIRDTATSLWLERGGQETALEKLREPLAAAIERRCAQAQQDFASLRREGIARSYLIGHVVTVQQESRTVRGLATDLGPNGELIVETEDGLQTISVAERVRRATSDEA
jgi:BirA family transcriptional regulator, biotin operon repressor / biotin---[acetyl-CoA-carboxylase] ligase